MVEGLNLGLPRNKSRNSVVASTELKLGTSGLPIQHANHLAMLTPVKNVDMNLVYGIHVACYKFPIAGLNSVSRAPDRCKVMGLNPYQGTHLLSMPHACDK